MPGPRIIDLASLIPQKNAALIRVLFKREMPPLEKQAMRFGEWIDIQTQMRGKPFGISLGKIDKTGLAAAGATSPALELFHRTEKGRPEIPPDGL